MTRVTVEQVERDHRQPLENATILVTVDSAEEVLLKASRWRRGRWSLLNFNASYESGQPFDDAALNDRILGAAARALRIRKPTIAELDGLDDRVGDLEREALA